MGEIEQHCVKRLFSVYLTSRCSTRRHRSAMSWKPLDRSLRVWRICSRLRSLSPTTWPSAEHRDTPGWTESTGRHTIIQGWGAMRGRTIPAFCAQHQSQGNPHVMLFHVDIIRYWNWHWLIKYRQRTTISSTSHSSWVFQCVLVLSSHQLCWDSKRHVSVHGIVNSTQQPACVCARTRREHRSMMSVYKFTLV